MPLGKFQGAFFLLYFCLTADDFKYIPTLCCNDE